MRQRMQFCQTTIPTWNPLLCSGNIVKQILLKTSIYQFIVLNLLSIFSAFDYVRIFSPSCPPVISLFQLWPRGHGCVRDSHRINYILEWMWFWVLPRWSAGQGYIQVNWDPFIHPTSCSYPQCLCINVYSTNETKNHRMILAMWEKRKGHAMTPFQRRWLYPMAWRRLNKYLPGYLLCFFTNCSMLEF